MSSSRYPIPCGFHRSEIDVERSRFITSSDVAATPAEAQDFIARIKGAYPDANHNCWAYVCGPPGSSDRIGYSDDGEPHGCAGKPMLTALQHSGVGDIVVVVTRYFGGVKLGKGGMVKAYTQAILSAVEQLARCEKVDWQELGLRFDYALLGSVERLLPEFEAEILKREFTEQIELLIRLPRENLAAGKAHLTDLTAGKIDFREEG